MDLISRPLLYLGFQVGDAHLQTILINTNYYPGILQFFGYTLVQTLTSKYAQYYHATNNPPFVLNDMQLGNVMADESLNDSIRSRFHLSLNLDQRYFMLARCIALLYYTQEEYLVGDQHGFTQKQISDCAKSIKFTVLNSSHRRLPSIFSMRWLRWVSWGVQKAESIVCGGVPSLILSAMMTAVCLMISTKPIILKRRFNHDRL